MVLRCELEGFHIVHTHRCIDEQVWPDSLPESNNILLSDDPISVIEKSIDSIGYFVVEVPSKTLSLSDQLVLYLLGPIPILEETTADLIKRTETTRLMFGPRAIINTSTNSRESLFLDRIFNLNILKKVYTKKWFTVQPSVTNNGSAYPDSERSSSALMPVLLPPVNLKRQNRIIVHVNAKSNGINGGQITNKSKEKFNSRKNSAMFPNRVDMTSPQLIRLILLS
ncbi:hypothetical protein ACTXT7_004755 [Hymenolepis weldensis]